MARIFTGQYGCSVYGEVIDAVRRGGVRRDSRNGVTYDLPDVTISLESPLNALPLACGRKPSQRIAAAEALQLIGGFSAPEWLCRVAPGFDRYREANQQFWGAYGNRLTSSGVRQLEQVIAKLRSAPDTRQAVITLWDPLLDNVAGKRDYPCTVALNFRRSGTRYRQHNRLDAQVLMRSNDVWLGLPYDMFQFTQLQLTLCNVLGLDPGTYTHTAWSMHMYLSNMEESYDVTDSVAPSKTLPQVTGLGNLRAVDSDPSARHIYEHIHGRAQAIVNQSLHDYTVSEAWYLDVLKDFPLSPPAVDVAPGSDRDGPGAGEAQPV